MTSTPRRLRPGRRCTGRARSTAEEPPVGQALGDERAPRSPPAVDRLLADSRFLGDALDRELLVAHLLEHLRGRGEDGLSGRGAANRARAVLVHGSRLTPREPDETVRMIKPTSRRRHGRTALSPGFVRRSTGVAGDRRLGAHPRRLDRRVPRLRRGAQQQLRHPGHRVRCRRRRAHPGASRQRRDDGIRRLPDDRRLAVHRRAEAGDLGCRGRRRGSRRHRIGDRPVRRAAAAGRTARSSSPTRRRRSTTVERSSMPDRRSSTPARRSSTRRRRS